MAKTRIEIQNQLEVLGERWKTYKKSERAGAQNFLTEFLQCFGRVFDPNNLPFEVRNGDNTIMDCYLPGECIIEVKNPRKLKTTEDLKKAKRQIQKYHDSEGRKTRYLILTNFTQFFIHDTRDGREKSFHISAANINVDSFGFLMEKSTTYIPEQEAVTKEAAIALGKLLRSLKRKYPNREKDTERFILQCMFCLFAEKTGYLEDLVFTKCVQRIYEGQESSVNILGSLFRRLDDDNNDCRSILGIPVSYFNGALFSKKPEFQLSDADIAVFHKLCHFDWAKVRPEIFGTLFESVIDPETRRETGMHYTSEHDIMKVVQPCIVDYWNEKLANCKHEGHYREIHDELMNYRVLDPACGSGNFLIVAYREIKKVEKRIFEAYASCKRISYYEAQLELAHYPIDNLYGIEIKSFPAFLTKVSLWITQKQLTIEHHLTEKILPLGTLKHILEETDALFHKWDKVNVVIGNPPFHGAKKIRDIFGDKYIKDLKDKFEKHNQMSDYCSYWYRKAIDEMPKGTRIGFVSTNTIRQTNTRAASLDYIFETNGEIFSAVYEQKWSGTAKVFVSIVNFMNRQKFTGQKHIDGRNTDFISSRLLSFIPDWEPRKLKENYDLAFVGVVPNGNFFIDDKSKVEKEVVKNHLSGSDITKQKTNIGAARRRIIDFGCLALDNIKDNYPSALNIVKEQVMPKRNKLESNTQDNKHYKKYWWQFGRPQLKMKDTINQYDRFIAISRVSKYPCFIMIDNSNHDVLPGDSTVVIGWDDWFHYGVLNSIFHEEWYKYQSSSLKGDPRYTNTTIFETFPFPYLEIPEISKAGEKLDLLRKELCNKNQISLTHLYNTMNQGGYKNLTLLHEKINKAVAKAYGYKGSLNDRMELLLFLLKENRERYEIETGESKTNKDQISSQSAV